MDGLGPPHAIAVVALAGAITLVLAEYGGDVVISIVLLGAAFIVVPNVLRDAAYAWPDPHVRLS